MYSFIRVAFPFLLLITAFSCNTTDPPGEDNTLLKWDVDTITYPESFQTTMQTIWGNSPNDVWIAGHNNRGVGKGFHYDGKEWKEFRPVTPSQYKFDTYDLTSSLNLGNEVFLCGAAAYLVNDTRIHFVDSSLILSLTGNNWSVSQLGNGGAIQSISGSKNGKLYATGVDLTLFSYEGSQWVRKALNMNFPGNPELNINAVLVDRNQNGYMIINTYDTVSYASYNYFAKESNGNWIKVDSFDNNVYPSEWGGELWESADGTIYSCNPSLYKYANNHWDNIFGDTDIITKINGTVDNNIYAAGHGVYHFDGKSWYEYKELRNKYGLARDIFLIDGQVFVLFSNSASTFVLKGHR